KIHAHQRQTCCIKPFADDLVLRGLNQRSAGEDINSGSSEAVLGRKQRLSLLPVELILLGVCRDRLPRVAHACQRRIWALCEIGAGLTKKAQRPLKQEVAEYALQPPGLWPRIEKPAQDIVVDR